MSKRSQDYETTHSLLRYIDSLHIATVDQIGPKNVTQLRARGFIREVWIGNYALTDAGKAARKRGR